MNQSNQICHIEIEGLGERFGSIERVLVNWTDSDLTRSINMFLRNGITYDYDISRSFTQTHNNIRKSSCFSE